MPEDDAAKVPVIHGTTEVQIDVSHDTLLSFVIFRSTHEIAHRNAMRAVT
jgi:hypothetical protein